MLRLSFLSVFSVACCSFLCAISSPAADERPNILFMFSDDHAYQAISAYDASRNKTPNIDRLAKEGMRFDRAFVTNSICGPSRAVVQTGKYSHLNGFPDNSAQAWFNGAQTTAPKLLQTAGYQTAVVGKWHLNSDPVGFNYWEILLGQGPYYNPQMKTAAGLVKHEGYTTDIITDLALEWLKNKRAKDKPFFLMYQHKAPHRQWQPAPRHLDKYKNMTLPEPETLFDDYSGREKPAADQAMTVANHLTPDDLKFTAPAGLTPEQRDTFTKAYAEENKKFE